MSASDETLTTERAFVSKLNQILVEVKMRVCQPDRVLPLFAFTYILRGRRRPRLSLGGFRSVSLMWLGFAATAMCLGCWRSIQPMPMINTVSPPLHAADSEAGVATQLAQLHSGDCWGE